MSFVTVATALFMHLSTAAWIRTYFVVHPKLHATPQEEI